MSISPLLALHICTGVIGFFAGALAVSFRKGSRGHAAAGTLFVISMLCLAASGVGLAIMKSRPGDVLGGALTFYLVATGWMTARRRTAGAGVFDWIALVFLSGLGALIVIYATEAVKSPTGIAHGYRAGPYLFLGSVALAACVGDVRLLIRGGISGTPRIARHLWRMCFAFFIAAASIFLARQALFPAFLRKTGILLLLSFLPLLLMIFWLVRIRTGRVYMGGLLPRMGARHSKLS